MLSKFSIRELLLFVLVIANFIALWSSRKTAYELSELRQEVGYIRQDSKEVIYVRQRDAERQNEWRFRVLVPRGADYRYVWQYDLAGAKPVNPPYSIECREQRQHNLVVYLENQKISPNSEVSWLALARASSMIPMLGVDSDVFKNFVVFNQSVFSDGFGATYEYDSGLFEFPVGDTVTLLRLEGKDPESGKEMWIELNMVPMTKAEKNAMLRKNAPPNIPINGRMSTMGGGSSPAAAQPQTEPEAQVN